MLMTGILMGVPYSGPRSEVTDWRMEAKVLSPVGKVRASLWFIGAWLQGLRGKVAPWQVARKTRASVNGIQNMRLYTIFAYKNGNGSCL